MTKNKAPYIVIHEFMWKELELSNSEMVIFSIIFGFSEAKGNTFFGGVSYLMDCTNLSRHGVDEILKKLAAKDLIEKRKVYTKNHWKVTKKIAEKWGSKGEVKCTESGHLKAEQCTESGHKQCTESGHSIYITKKEENKKGDKGTTTTISLAKGVDEMLSDFYKLRPALKEPFERFLINRRKRGFTRGKLRGILNDILEYLPDDATAIEEINISTRGNYGQVVNDFIVSQAKGGGGKGYLPKGDNTIPLEEKKELNLARDENGNLLTF